MSAPARCIVLSALVAALSALVVVASAATSGDARPRADRLGPVPGLTPARSDAEPSRALAQVVGGAASEALPSTGLRSVAAREAALEDDDLVLGVIGVGGPVAFPVRYLALFEVVNDRLGKIPVAATW